MTNLEESAFVSKVLENLEKKEDVQMSLSKLEEASIKILIGMMQYEDFMTLRDYYASQSVLAARRLLKECDRQEQNEQSS